MVRGVPSHATENGLYALLSVVIRAAISLPIGGYRAKPQGAREGGEPEQRAPRATAERAQDSGRRKSLAAKKMLSGARLRARQKDLEFSLSISTIEWADVCPIFGYEMTYTAVGERCAASASLDRIDPKRGYTPDNVWVISWRANRIKADATLGELNALVQALRARAGRLLDGRTHDEFPRAHA